MKNCSFFFAIIAMGLLQATIVNSFALFNIKPDLLLVAAVIAGLFCEEKFALLLGLLAGLMKDIFCFDRIAVNTVLFPLWTWLILRLSRKLSVDNNILGGLLVFVFALLNAIAAKLLLLFMGNFIRWGVFLRITFPEALYTALVSLLIFKSTKIFKNAQ